MQSNIVRRNMQWHGPSLFTFGKIGTWYAKGWPYLIWQFGPVSGNLSQNGQNLPHLWCHSQKKTFFFIADLPHLMRA